MLYLELFFTIVIGYLLGSISFGIIVTRIVKGVDIRDYGSGNAGMTNVLRIVGKGPGAIVLLGDALKGVAAVAVGLYLGGEVYGVIGGIMALIGHGYPLYFGFKGGKGVATGLGVMIILVPEVSAIALVIFLLIVFISGYVSLGSILATSSVPISMILLHKSLPLIILGLLGAAFVIYAHRSNIKNLYHGTEYSFRDKKRKRG